MTFVRKSGGGNVTPTTVKRRSGGTWANVQTIKRRLSGAWVTVWTAYTAVTATVNFTSVSGTGTGSGQQTVSSNAPVAVGHNGTGTYTYAWQFVSGDNTIVPDSATSATSGFHATLLVGATKSAVYRCLISDGTTSAYTPNVTVNLSN